MIKDERCNDVYTLNDLQGVMDIKKILQGVSAAELKRYPVALTNSKKSGVGLVANRNLKKGTTVAYYRMRAVKISEHNFPNGNMYTFEIYGITGKPYEALIGDLAPESIPTKKTKIPPFGHLSNEPQKRSQENVVVDEDTNYNYRMHGRVRIWPGDHVRYKLVASRDISKGEPITWCYGDAYVRNYKTECAKKMTNE